jgi:hypothetical protein
VSDYDALIERVYAEIEPIARAGGEWEALALAHRAALDPPAQFVDWARDHRRWCFAVAEAAGEVCAKPPEAAAHVLLKILAELLEDRGVTD